MTYSPLLGLLADVLVSPMISRKIGPSPSTWGMMMMIMMMIMMIMIVIMMMMMMIISRKMGPSSSTWGRDGIEIGQKDQYEDMQEYEEEYVDISED